MPEIPVVDFTPPIQDQNWENAEWDPIDFDWEVEPQKLSELRKENRRDKRNSKGPGLLSRFIDNIGKEKPRYKKSIRKQKNRFRRVRLKDGGLAKFLDGGSGGPKSREQIYEESLSDTGVESGDLSDYNTAGTDAIYYLDSPDYFKNNPINTGNPEYDAQVKKAIFENNMGWNPHNQSIYFKQWEASKPMETLPVKPIESIEQDIVEREMPEHLEKMNSTFEDLKTDPRFEVLFREAEEEVKESSSKKLKTGKQDGKQKKSKTPKVLHQNNKVNRFLQSIGFNPRNRRRRFEEGGVTNNLSKFLDGGPSEDELAYFVDDGGKPFKYQGKTWGDVLKLSDEEQRDYIEAFSNYEKLKDKRDYESNRKSKLDPFYKLDPYGYGKKIYGRFSFI